MVDDEARGTIGFINGAWFGLRSWFIDKFGNANFNNTVVNGLLKAYNSIINTVRSTNYSGEGMLDTGWMVTDSYGGRNSKAIFDYLYIRKKALFEKLELRAISHIGGDFALSPASGKAYRVEYYDADDNILGEEEILDLDEDKLITVNMNQEQREEEFLDLMNSLLKIKNSSIDTSKINKKWLNKYQYVYKLCNVLEYKDTYSLVELIEHPSFREIYDYDLDKIGLYENVRNLLYEMPIYIFAKVLFMAVLYNDDAIFDAVFKIMKYKVLIDKNNNFRVVANNYSLKQIKSLITFIEKVSKKYDNKNVFELDKIKRLVKIKNYINE